MYNKPFDTYLLAYQPLLSFQKCTYLPSWESACIFFFFFPWVGGGLMGFTLWNFYISGIERLLGMVLWHLDDYIVLAQNLHYC